MECRPGAHLWKVTGRHDQHTRGGVPDIFKHPVPVVHFVRCEVCRQDGFYRSHSRVIYTWSKADV